MKLHSYQRRAADFARQQDRSALLMEMGLGKTATTLTAMEQRHVPMLVVAPKRVVETVWHTEAKLWRPGLNVVRATGTPTQRKTALADTTAHVVVISRDNMSDAIPYMGRFNSLVLDELSSFKNPSTKRFKAAKTLAGDIPVVWGLTGTPAPNGLMDLWAQVYLLDGGARLGKTLIAYRNRYFYAADRLPNGIVTKWVARQGSFEAITSKLSDITLAMRAQDYLDLPPVTHNLVQVPMPADAMRLYRQMLETMVAQLDDEPVTAANGAARVGKLAQITAGFMYLQDELGQRIPGAVSRLHSAKVDAVEEIVEGTGSPVLVYYWFQEELAMLKERFPQAATIDDKDVVNRWNAGEVPLLLAHPASAGHGLNLQKGPGHTIVWTTCTWAAEVWAQANARLARQGQGAPVVVHVLQGAGTNDDVIYDVVTGKVTLEQGVLKILGKGTK